MVSVVSPTEKTVGTPDEASYPNLLYVIDMKVQRWGTVGILLGPSLLGLYAFLHGVPIYSLEIGLFSGLLFAAIVWFGVPILTRDPVRVRATSTGVALERITRRGVVTSDYSWQEVTQIDDHISKRGVMLTCTSSRFGEQVVILPRESYVLVKSLRQAMLPQG